MADSPFLYPNVTSIPGTRLDPSQVEKKKPDGVKSDFDHVYDQALEQSTSVERTSGSAKGNTSDATRNLNVGSLETSGLTKDLGAVKQPLKFSSHASQRLQERRIKLDSATMSKVTDAVDKAEAKGIEDTLVLTNDAALIVNVKNRTVITAMDKQSLNGNVFTNIDGAVIV